MNYLPFVSWGMYGGTSAKERANLFASWGLMADLPAIVSNIIIRVSMFYKKLRSQ